MKISVRNAFETSTANADVRVFIDVFRASSTLAHMLKKGNTEILGAKDPATVEKYKTEGYVVISEVMAGGLDNSPSQAISFGNGGKFIQKTGNFTAAVFANLNFTRAVSAAFVNIGAVCEYLIGNRFESVDVVACGHFDERVQAVEDSSCAEMLRLMLSGEKPRQLPYFNAILEKIEKRRSGRFQFPAHYWRDLELALQCDTASTVPVIRKRSDEGVVFSNT